MFGAQEKNTTFRKKTKNMFQVLNLQQVHDIGPLFVSGALAKVINVELVDRTTLRVTGSLITFGPLRPNSPGVLASNQVSSPQRASHLTFGDDKLGGVAPFTASKAAASASSKSRAKHAAR